MQNHGNSYSYFQRQLVYSIIGIMLALFISIIDYRIYKNTKFLGLVFIILVLATISVKFLGRDAKGAVRWIQIGRITLQPSEFVKVGMIVIIAGFFSELEKRNKLKDPIWSVLVPLVVGGFVAGIIFFMQNHLSAAVLVMTTLLIQMFIAGINFKALITVMIAGMIGGYFAITSIFKKASRTDLDKRELKYGEILLNILKQQDGKHLKAF
ncbi:MAG: FtsW/RodA/SpoVE family cell cycle protein [Clostridiales bacterium]|nr:FtsW/RodA/SpoVE family cell cycle protein [Clostridiales bacterium]